MIYVYAYNLSRRGKEKKKEEKRKKKEEKKKKRKKPHLKTKHLVGLGVESPRFGLSSFPFQILGGGLMVLILL